ncbi:MAG: hypothetical protein PHF86_12250 [Candidatus Nanoarchaeia archaeon]|nr:hypothetical protein [Candidatus Nanoarchaeia archaeon]
MEKENIYDLIKKGLISLSINELYDLTQDLFDEKYNVPLVINQKFIDGQRWELWSLEPKNSSDKITIINFLEGLRKVKNLCKDETLHIDKIKGDIHLCSLDSRHYSNDGEIIATLGLHSGEYGNDLYIKKGDGNTYVSISEIVQPSLEEIMFPHMGPNIRSFKRFK